MCAKVDQTSAVEPHGLKMSATTSTASTGAPKLSMFARKSGFVIPKNKLSGSLVPVFRGGKTPGGYDAVQEESGKQVQRKTKWGPDLTQDADVRKGRALAYQTRVDQITQQLKSGILEAQDNQDLPLAAQQAAHKSSIPQVDSEKSELLELERREAIGEILKLNPSYKAPADYEPVLKEARVYIPVKEYPRYNFVGLIFGPERETQKRFEKETGAKIKVYCTNVNTGEKVEVSLSDGNGIQAAYEELHVDVSADSYEKVDAAVALIELLITSVSDNLAAGSTSTPVSGDNVNGSCQGQNVTTPSITPPALMNPGAAQAVAMPTQFPPRGQFQYQFPWFPTGPAQNPLQPTGFAPPSNSLAPILNNSLHAQSSPANPSNIPSLVGPQPTPVAGFNSVSQNSSIVTPRVLPNPHMAHLHSLSHTSQTSNSSSLGPQPTSAQTNNLLPFPYTSAQPPQTGPAPTARPLIPSLPQLLSTGPNWGPRPGVPQIASSAISGISVAAPAPTSIQSSSPVIPGAPSPPALQLAFPNSVSGGMANFTQMKPPTVMTPRPQHPITGDFTFQHQLPQNSVSQMVHRPIHHPAIQNAQPPTPMVQQPPPPFQLASPQMQVYPGTHAGNQRGQPQAHLSSAPFTGNPNAISVPPRLPTFAISNPLVQMGLRNINPPNRMAHDAGPFPPRPGNPMQTRPENIMAPNQRFSGNIPIAGHTGGQQVYDPFLPSSVYIAPQPQGNNPPRVGKQDDPEYEDLMASVGVK